MSKFEKQFFSLLKEEEEVDALDATPEDDAEAFNNSLEEPETGGDFEEVSEPNINYQEDLKTLQSWINAVDQFKSYLNGDESSILGKLRAEAKIGTLFDDITDSAKSEILDIAERLASLNEQCKNLYTEKHK